MWEPWHSTRRRSREGASSCPPGRYRDRILCTSHDKSLGTDSNCSDLSVAPEAEEEREDQSGISPLGMRKIVPKIIPAG